MPEIAENCEFIIKAKQVRFRTNADEDEVLIFGLNLTQEQAASLGWLINNVGTTELKVEIKLS